MTKKQLLILILLLYIKGFSQNSVPVPPAYSGPLGAKLLRPVNGIATDTSYNLWVAFGKVGLGKFDRYLWTMYDSTNSSLPINKIIAVACNKAGVWAGTDTGLYNYNGTSWSWYNISNSNIPSDTIPHLYSSGNTDLFIYSNHGFVYFNGSTFQNYNKGNSGIVDDSVQCILKSATGLWWIGTKHGLSSFDGSLWQSYTAGKPFSCDDNILSLNEDKNNSLFVGTYSGGVQIKIGNSFVALKNYISPSYYSPVSVYNQLRLSNGDIMVTTNDTARTAPQFIVSTYPINVVNKKYPSFTFQASNYLYAIDHVNRIYKSQISAFSMSYTDSINVPFYNDSVNMTSLRLLYSSENFLDINEVTCPIWNNDAYFWDLTNNIARYYVPKSDCGPEKTAVYASAIWIGGLDAGNNLHVSAQTYHQSGNDFWPGPLDTITTLIDPATKTAFDTVWKVNRDTLNQFITQYNLGNVTNNSYQVPSEILNWPAQGSGSYAKYMAPFFDHNNDGIYNPYDGDYPRMKGDQMLWWVMNDNYAAHTETGCPSLGIEVRSEAYAYTCPSVADSEKVINYTTLYSDSIINRSSQDYHDVYIGIWVDVDLGFPNDDYVGCRADGNYAFVYNGDSIDDGSFGYGHNPPMLSCVAFNDTMTHFMYYNNDFSTTGNVVHCPDFYNYLQSIWIDGTHLTYGGSGYGGNSPTNYFFPGIPYDTGWTEASAGNTPSDRRFLMSVGPLTLKAKESKNLDYAFVFSWDKTQPNGATTSVAQNDRDVRKITKWFNTQSFPCNHLVGINEKSGENIGFELYPNPAQKCFYIDVSKMKSSKLALELLDITGRVIKKETIFPDRLTTVGIENIVSGIYFVRISDKNSFYSKKLIIE